MNLSKFGKANKPENTQDDYSKLLCTQPGCGRKWSVQVDRPLCSLHQWGNIGDPFVNLANYADTDASLDGKGWARRLIARHKAGDSVRPYSLKLAQGALKSHVQVGQNY